MLLVNTLICLLLLIIGIQDYKDREVSLWVFIALGTMACLKIILYGFTAVYIEVLFNMVILLIQMLLLYLYFNLIRKKNIVGMIGLGDIIFFAIIALSFSLVNFILFQILSLIVALVFSVFAQFKNKEFIPLAGIQAICLMLVVGLEMGLGTSLSYELVIMSY